MYIYIKYRQYHRYPKHKYIELYHEFANCKKSGDLGTGCDRKACMDCLAGQEKNMAAWSKIPRALILPEDLQERKNPPELFALPSWRFVES
jgi:hypothetical protein